MKQDYFLARFAAQHPEQDTRPNWCRPKINPKVFRKLTQKSDAFALRDTLLWRG
jgi:hypothetical protein